MRLQVFTYTETAEVTALLARLDALRARLDIGATLPRRWAGRLRREIETNAIAASTSMEGVRVTADDVRRILVGDIPASVSPEDARLVAGYRDAMAFVLRRADDARFEWHPEIVRGIHDRVLGGSYATGAGLYRSGTVYIVSQRDGHTVFSPPDAEDVPDLLERGLAQLTAADYPAPVSSVFVHMLVAAVHPFSDGNGRTARICASLAMYRGGFVRPEFTSLEEWWGSHLDDYCGAFDALGTEWSEGADITSIVVTHLSAQVSQVEEYEVRLGAQVDVWTALENISEHVADARATEALYDAFLGRAITNRYYREIAAVSAVTAAADMARLVAAGLLQATGAGSKTEYVATAKLMQTMAEEFNLVGGWDATEDLGDQRRQILAFLRMRVQER